MSLSQFNANRCQLLGTWLSCFVALALFCCAGKACASLVSPDFPAFSAEKLAESASSTGAATSDDCPIDETKKSIESETPPEFALPGAPTSTGGAAGGGISLSGASTTMADVGRFAIAIQPSTDVLGWLSGEERLSLPEAPGNDLLRPPQSV